MHVKYTFLTWSWSLIPIFDADPWSLILISLTIFFWKSTLRATCSERNMCHMRHKQMESQCISLPPPACVKLTLSTDASQADGRHLRYISLSASCQHVMSCHVMSCVGKVYSRKFPCTDAKYGILTNTVEKSGKSISNPTWMESTKSVAPIEWL